MAPKKKASAKAVAPTLATSRARRSNAGTPPHRYGFSPEPLITPTHRPRPRGLPNRRKAAVTKRGARIPQAVTQEDSDDTPSPSAPPPQQPNNSSASGSGSASQGTAGAGGSGGGSDPGSDRGSGGRSNSSSRSTTSKSSSLVSGSEQSGDPPEVRQFLREGNIDPTEEADPDDPDLRAIRRGPPPRIRESQSSRAASPEDQGSGSAPRVPRGVSEPPRFGPQDNVEPTPPVLPDFVRAVLQAPRPGPQPQVANPQAPPAPPQPSGGGQQPSGGGQQPSSGGQQASSAATPGPSGGPQGTGGGLFGTGNNLPAAPPPDPARPPYPRPDYGWGDDDFNEFFQ